MTCCNSGTAIVKFKPYKQGKFKYRLTPSSQWQEINADEGLTGICEDTVSYIPGGNIVFYFKTKREIISTNIDYVGHYNDWISPGSYWVENAYGFHSTLYAKGFKASGEETTAAFQAAYADYVPVGWGAHPNLSPVFKVKFTVKSAETGAEYLSLTNLDQCPEVQQGGCQLQPEQQFNVELKEIDGGAVSLLLRALGKTVPLLPDKIRECIRVDPDPDNPYCVLVKKQWGLSYELFLGLVEIVIGTSWETVAKKLCSDPGCPPPQVTVVCGEDEKDDQCPPETDCELVCNGFRCCYHKGKLIKAIPL